MNRLNEEWSLKSAFLLRPIISPEEFCSWRPKLENTCSIPILPQARWQVPRYTANAFTAKSVIFFDVFMGSVFGQLAKPTTGIILYYIVHPMSLHGLPEIPQLTRHTADSLGGPSLCETRPRWAWLPKNGTSPWQPMERRRRSVAQQLSLAAWIGS